MTRSSLCFAGLSILALACSSAAPEDSSSTSSAITGVLLSLGSSAGQITNGNGGCLDLPSGNTTNGTLLHIWACDSNGVNQTWYVDFAGSIHYGANPLKCVVFPSQDLDSKGIPIDETQLEIWDCAGATTANQQWTFAWGGQIELTSDSEKCVELRNGSPANNTPVQIYDCNGTKGQTWQLVQGGPVQGFQLQDGNGACLDLPSGNTANGTLLHLWQCDANGQNQTWYFDGRGGLHYAADPTQCVDFPAQDWTTTGVGFIPMSQLQLWTCNNGAGPDQELKLNANSTLQIAGKPCVEARNGSDANGTVVQGFGCNGTTGQTWFPAVVGDTICGQHVGELACSPATSPYCAPWDISITPMQPLYPSGGVCVACGNYNQPECTVGASSWCQEGLMSLGTCLQCTTGVQSATFCSANRCNDGTCQSGIVSSCPASGASANGVVCTNGCGSHGGVDGSLGCGQL